MRSLDLHINEDSPLIGNFLSLHCSFSFFHHALFFSLPLHYVIFLICSIPCKSSMKLAHILIAEKVQFREHATTQWEKQCWKELVQRSGQKLLTTPLLKGEFWFILRKMTIPCFQSCCLIIFCSVQTNSTQISKVNVFLCNISKMKRKQTKHLWDVRWLVQSANR